MTLDLPARDRDLFKRKAPRVLVADDQADITKALRLLLKSEGFSCKTVGSPEEVLEVLENGEFDVTLIDLNYARDTTSGQEGLDLIKGIRKLDNDLPIVVMTAWATVDLAVECMRGGADDFVQKPWDNNRLVTIVLNQAALYRRTQRQRVLEDENRVLREAQAVPKSDFIAQAASMKPVVDIIERVGPSDANVLITGENGTGKGVIAKLLHERSLRAANPFVSINMGGIAAGVAESELFGHVKGAFTDAKADRAGRFEMADNGTLFLDEIGNIPMEQQNKLLRVLETGEFERVGSSRTRKVDVRFVSATNADLDAEVTEGRFRQDLLYRLNTIHLQLPPLRERLEDIPLLAEAFLARHLKRYGKSDLKGFSSGALDTLRNYGWPGNVRELDHCIERAVLLANAPQIQSGDLGLSRSAGQVGATALDDMSLDEVEKYLMERTLLRHGGNATKAAEDLGLSRSAFYRRRARFGV